MTVVIDGTQIASVAQLHTVLAQKLSFPAWYGNNFDALSDCLTDIATPVQIQIVHLAQLKSHLGTAADILLHICHRAAVENANLEIQVSKEDAM